MVRSADELAALDFEDYAGIYIGGGNTFKLLQDAYHQPALWLHP